MRFKTKALKAEWEHTWVHPTLRAVVHLLDVEAKMRNDGYILITCIHRRDDHDSYHSVGRAMDIRIWGWSFMFRGRVSELLNYFRRRISFEIQHEFETGPKHLHIEIDNGSIRKKKLLDR